MLKYYCYIAILENIETKKKTKKKKDPARLKILSRKILFKQHSVWH